MTNPNISLKLRPFIVPNFVSVEALPKQRQDGVSFPCTFPLCAVGEDELSRMCDEFRAEIFKKAGKTDPKNV